MKKIVLFFFLIVVFNCNAQDSWKKKSYGSLQYSFPQNWTELQYQFANGNSSYGCQYFDVGKTAQFTVLEIPNDSQITNAHEISTEEIKNLFTNIFSPNSNFKFVENKTLSNINAKYLKATAITSKGLKLATVGYLFFYKGKMIIVQGIYTSEDEDKFLPLINEIINTVKTI